MYPDSRPHQQPLLSTSGLTLQKGGKQLCSYLNWQIYPGQIWGILGRNGSGKTTLLHTLMGLEKPEHGRILLKGCDLKDYQQIEIAKNIGLLLQQDSSNFSGKVAEIVLTGRHPHLGLWSRLTAKDQSIAAQALQSMELNNFLQRGINTLSGGERRRLELATVLTQQPLIFLLDEPTNHLDLNLQSVVLNHFRKVAIAEKKTVVMALHDVNLASNYCTHLLLMINPSMCLHGPVAEVLTLANLEALYQCQFRQINNQQRTFWLAE